MPPLLLHSGHEVTWSAWHLEPTVFAGALLVLGLYIYAIQTELPRFELRRVLLFFSGAATLLIALVSPLDTGADRLLSLHMLQHVVLATIGPPLVLLGLPRQPLERLFSHRLLAPSLSVITLPLVTSTLFITNMWFWHVPNIYQSALDNLGLHVVMHIAFIATGLVFWWPVIQPLAQKSAIGEGGRLLYLFVSGFPMGVLALLLIASADPVYSYYESAPRLWGISAIEDQQIAGVIMGSLGEAASFIAMTLVFFRYLGREEQPDPAISRGSIDAA